MQQSIFHEPPTEMVSIDDAAINAQVSSATIRNWIKTGHLTFEKKGFVNLKSLNDVLAGRLVDKKLIGRANKSQKDFHDHKSLSSNVIAKLIDTDSDLSELSESYQASLSDSFRNREGIYYTPPNIVKDLFDIKTETISTSTFLDPCCGSGNFVVRAVELGFRPEHIFGYDTDPVAVALTKKRLLKLTGFNSPNIKNLDFLEETISTDQILFDYIYTNPPWGKKLDKQTREKYSRAFKATGSVDTCCLFMFASLQRLKSGGELGLLLPDSFFNIAAFENARFRALSLQIQKVIDYERPFKSLLTKAFAIVLKNETASGDDFAFECKSKSASFKRPLISFTKNPKSIINFQTRPENALVIQHLFSQPHVCLSGKDKWGLGTVTGNNEKFIKTTESDGYIPVFRGSDISMNGLSQPSCFIPDDFSQYQQVAPLSLYHSPIKLIYKFISSSLCFFCDNDQRYVLNSANFVIPNANFPITPDQLCSLLNSEVINWLFANLFRTHKILRADLKSIPIHAEYFQKHLVFEEQKYLEFLSLEKDGYGAYRTKI